MAGELADAVRATRRARRNTEPVQCCNCGKIIAVGDGYSIRVSRGSSELRFYNTYRRGGWATRHVGRYDPNKVFTYICEPTDQKDN